MDKRLKPLVDPYAESRERDAVYLRLKNGELPIGQAIRAFRKLSRLTQPEFAEHRGISLDSLRALESGKGNPTIETINKVVSIFGLHVGLVPKR